MQLGIYLVSALLLVAGCSDKKQASISSSDKEINPYILEHAREDVPNTTHKLVSRTASLFKLATLCGHALTCDALDAAATTPSVRPR